MSAITNRERFVGLVVRSRTWALLRRPWWRWVPVLFGVVYLILLAANFGSIIGNIYLDADTASAPVIAELSGAAAPHAHIVLGTFGWYSTLIFDLATRWLPLHRQIWEAAPYAMVLAAAVLIAWSVWVIAPRWVAALSAVLIVCAGPSMLHLLISTTEHGPDWFCLALLGAYLVVVQRPGLRGRLPLIIAVTPLVGVAVGINAASDGLVEIAGLVPFGLALLVCLALRRGRDRFTSTAAGAAVLVIMGVAWAATRIAMSGAHVTPQPGVDNTLLAVGDHISSNFKLWWQSIAILGNGDFFGDKLTFTSGLAVICAVLSIGAVALLPRLGWRELSLRTQAREPLAAPHRLAFVVYWCCSATLLTGAFLISATPVDVFSSRYLPGLIYAAAAIIPLMAAGRPVAERAVVVGSCAFALAAVIAIADGRTVHSANVALTEAEVNQVIGIAERNHLALGYAGYWEAAPITWSSHMRVAVYPVLACGATLCPFYLHFISSWYTPRPNTRTFLLTSNALPFVPAPPASLGRASAVYHAGDLTMYVYPYDLASKMP